MSDIFLSYKSEDSEKAQKIAKAIEKKGYTVWWDRIIPPGRNFDDVIEEELDEAKCVVVLWSGKSIKSKWVKTEASEGDRRGILVPVLIEDVRPPLAFRLMEAAKLKDWDGTSLHHEFDLLIQSVGRILGRPTPMDSRRIEQEGKAESWPRWVTPIQPMDFRRTELGEERTGEKIVTNSIDMKFTLIPEGEFMMGSEDSDWSKPVHTVKIRTPFYLGIYPVTQREWKAIMGNNPSKFNGNDLPVESVSWNEVQDFIKKLNEKEGTNKYRLPTEAEWEYATRAGTATRYSFGDDDSKLGEFAWYDENSGYKTHPVGKKEANPWGLYDVHGNVWEWVQDEWHDTYKGAPTDGSAWEDGSDANRVLHGGGRLNVAGLCWSASRGGNVPGYRGRGLGFRLLQEV